MEEEEEDGSTTLGFLDDDLLIEILSRIPSTRSAFQCKSVCKRWCSLMSTPYFLDRFRLAAAADQEDINSSDRSFLISIKKPSNTNLVVNLAGQNPIPVVAYCNDLILCHWATDDNTEENYLCNPFTKQRVALEPLHCRRAARDWYVKFGLVYELAPDNYSIHRYRVVRLCDHLGGLPVEVSTYHSETCQWVESEFYPEEEFCLGSEIVAHSGKLHWVNLRGTSLYTYDPFTTRQEEQISKVDGPCLNSDRDDENNHHCLFHAGECGGVLRVTATENSEDSDNLKVWDLETDGHGRRNWRLKHKVSMSCISTEKAFAVGFSLKKKDVVFLLYVFHLVSYNLQSREFKVEGRGVHKGSGLTISGGVFRLQLPWWPTRIPKPCKQNA